MKKVFISGSISIKILPNDVKKSINNIINQKFEIIVGDALGIDSLVQNYCKQLNYHNVTVYSINLQPRYKADVNFKTKYIEVSKNIKSFREKQQEKDKAMTNDSDFTFVIWDGKSKGSYSNIIRGIENNKKVKVFLFNENIFIENTKVDKNHIESIYRKNIGYTASEVLNHFKSETDKVFKRTQDLNKYLLNELILKQDNKIYTPTNKYEDLFIIERYKGKIRGVKFKKEFISWFKQYIKKDKKYKQANLF